MGAISKLINSFDGSAEEKAEIAAQLDVLADLAKTKGELAVQTITSQLETAGSNLNKTLPITNVMDKVYETHALAKDGAGSITNAVKKSVESFIKGGSQNILDGVCNLLSEGLSSFLGSGEGTDDTWQRYFIVSLPPPSLTVLRFDFYAWQRMEMGKSIKTKVSCVSAFAGFKSVVDFTKLPWPTFLAVYSEQLHHLKLPESDMLAQIEMAEKIYERMTGQSVPKAPKKPGKKVPVPSAAFESENASEYEDEYQYESEDNSVKVAFDHGFVPIVG